jgi:hypothetical protein
VSSLKTIGDSPILTLLLPVHMSDYDVYVRIRVDQGSLIMGKKLLVQSVDTIQAESYNRPDLVYNSSENVFQELAQYIADHGM